MITVDCLQGSIEWVEVRLGIPTASSFSRIVTGTGRLSKSRDGYLAELLAEWFVGELASGFQGNDDTERGHDLEPRARSAYSLLTDLDPEVCGFIFRDEARMVGASPDALVGPDGLLELKCPLAGKHLLWLARDAVPTEHVSQLQGQLWVTGRKFVDFMSYFPGLPPFLQRVAPDPVYQAALDKHMPTFVDELLAGRERLLKMGVQRGE